MKLKLKKTMLVLLMTTLIPIRTPAIFATDNGLKTVTKEISTSIEKKIIKEKKALKKKYKKDFSYRFVAEKLGYFGKTKKNKANKKLKALSSKKAETDVVPDVGQTSEELKESKPIQEEPVEELKESKPTQTEDPRLSEEQKESTPIEEPDTNTENNNTEEPLINPKTGKPYTKLQLKRLKREQAMKNVKEYYVLGKTMTPHDHNSITENEPSPLRIRNITYFSNENVMDLKRTKDGKIYFKQYRFNFNTGKLIPMNEKDLFDITMRRNQTRAFHYSNNDFDITENDRNLTINAYTEYEIIGEVKK